MLLKDGGLHWSFSSAFNYHAAVWIGYNSKLLRPDWGTASLITPGHRHPQRNQSKGHFKPVCKLIFLLVCHPMSGRPLRTIRSCLLFSELIIERIGWRKEHGAGHNLNQFSQVIRTKRISELRFYSNLKTKVFINVSHYCFSTPVMYIQSLTC